MMRLLLVMMAGWMFMMMVWVLNGNAAAASLTSLDECAGYQRRSAGESSRPAQHEQQRSQDIAEQPKAYGNGTSLHAMTAP